MHHFNPRDLERGFVSKDGPRLSDLVPRIEGNTDLSATRRRDLLSALRIATTIIDWPMEEIPADAAWLRRKLGATTPAAHAMTPKRWGKVMSDLKAALRAGGIPDHTQGARGQLSPDWFALRTTLRAIERGEACWRGISRFVKFCSNLNVAPDAVSAKTLDAFGTALRETEIRKNPDHTIYSTATSWNTARDLVQGWPGAALPVLQRHDYYALPHEDFPESFRSDVEAYLARLRGEDILADGPDRPLSPTTVDSHSRSLWRFASAVAQSGVPIGEIKNLRCIVQIDAFKAGLQFMGARLDTTRSPGLGNMAKLLVKVARHYVCVTGEHLDELQRLAQRVTPPRQKGMTRKNRDRLRQVFTDDNLDRLLALPSDLANRAERLSSPRKSALMQETALAIDLLTVTALRIKNLAALDLERNIERSRRGEVRLVFAEAEVKNGLAIDKPLPASTVALTDRFLDGPRDLLLEGSSPWLFSARRRPEPICPRNFGKRIAKMILDATGLEMNPHLFRHTAAKFYLDANPGGYGGARLVLGHVRESSTIDAYAGLEGEAAARAFDDLVAKRRARGRG